MVRLDIQVPHKHNKMFLEGYEQVKDIFEDGFEYYPKIDSLFENGIHIPVGIEILGQGSPRKIHVYRINYSYNRVLEFMDGEIDSLDEALDILDRMEEIKVTSTTEFVFKGTLEEVTLYRGDCREEGYRFNEQKINRYEDPQRTKASLARSGYTFIGDVATQLRRELRRGNSSFKHKDKITDFLNHIEVIEQFSPYK